MVLPDGVSDRPQGESVRRHLTAIGLAAAAIFAGVVILSVLTEATTVTVPEMLVSQTSRSWDRVETVPDTSPYAVISHEDRLLLFTSTPPVQDPRPSGLQVWRSVDGHIWEHMGTVIDKGSHIDYIASTSLGLVAIGSVGGDNSIRAWLSTDGVSWLRLMDGLRIDTSQLLPAPIAGRLADTDASLVAEIEATVGEDGSVVLTQVGEGGGVALVERSPDMNRPYDIAAFEIWAASEH